MTGTRPMPAAQTDGAPRHPYPKLPRICDYVAHYAQISPDREALVLGDRRYTYLEFERSVERTAAALRSAGILTGDRIAMITTPRPEFAILLMAAMRLGAIWVGINPRYTQSEVDHVLGDCTPSMLFSITRDPGGRQYRDLVTSCRDRFPFLKRIVTLPDALPGLSKDFDGFLAAGDDPPSPWPRPEARDAGGGAAAAVIVYTSGTTGKPKGALLSNDNLIFSFDSVSRSFVGKEHLRENLRTLCNLPANHIGCISEMVGNTIVCGGTLVFAESFDAGDTLRLIESERITLFGGVPLMLEEIFAHHDAAKTDLSSVRIIGWGGAPITATLLETMAALDVHLFTNYGLTEGGAICSATPPDPSPDILCNTVGNPGTVQEYRIVGEDGEDVTAGATGEVWLRGRGVFLGYWNNPSATAQTIDTEAWLHTGDLVREREDGYWVLAGRKSEMFKSGGYNVYPREIELCLEQHPDVANAVVISVPDARFFEVGEAFVVPAPGRTITPAGLSAHLREYLAAYKVPKSIRILKVLPMLPIGKVDKQALQRMSS